MTLIKNTKDSSTHSPLNNFDEEKISENSDVNAPSKTIPFITIFKFPLNNASNGMSAEKDDGFNSKIKFAPKSKTESTSEAISATRVFCFLDSFSPSDIMTTLPLVVFKIQ